MNEEERKLYFVYLLALSLFTTALLSWSLLHNYLGQGIKEVKNEYVDHFNRELLYQDKQMELLPDISKLFSQISGYKPIVIARYKKTDIEKQIWLINETSTLSDDTRFVSFEILGSFCTEYLNSKDELANIQRSIIEIKERLGIIQER